MKVIERNLDHELLRRTKLRVTVEKKGRKISTTVELGTVTPHGTRWTQYNKLRKQLTHRERASIESQIIRTSQEMFANV